MELGGPETGSGLEGLKDPKRVDFTPLTSLTRLTMQEGKLEDVALAHVSR